MPRAVLLMSSSMRGGGSERQTLLLLRHLDRSVFTPHLYLTERAGELLKEVPSDVPIHSFDAVERPRGVYFPGRALAQQSRFLARVLTQQSIEVVYDRTFHMTLVAYRAARSLGIPRVSTIVSPPDQALPLVERRFVGLKRRRLSTAYRASRAVVAVSDVVARSAQWYYGLLPDSVTVISNPVDIDHLRQLASVDRPDRDQRLTLACVGRMTAEKGHRDLLEAIKLCGSRWPENQPPLCLWVIGDGPLRGQLQEYWKSVDSRHEVQFWGHRSNAAAAIAVADALVLPSRFEGMPNVVLEAMALGTPVIATRSGGTIGLERDEPTVLWSQPGHPSTLADALIDFASRRQAAQQRVEAAMRLVARDHDLTTTVQRIEQLLSRSD